MSYYPSEQWIDKLFGMRVPTLFDEPLNQSINYVKILALALKHKETDIGTVGFHGRPQNDMLFEIAKGDGLVLLTKIRGDLFPSDHIIVVPMGVENGKPQDFWILEMEEETYDGRPISSDLSDTVWRMHTLGQSFVVSVDALLTRFYDRRREKNGYSAINKRVI